jgi:hypothetical protein
LAFIEVLVCVELKKKYGCWSLWFHQWRFLRILYSYAFFRPKNLYIRVLGNE